MGMFGNKNTKQNRLEKIAELVRNAVNGISKAQLSRKLNVSRGTITKDMGIVEKATGHLFYEEDEFVHYYHGDAGGGYDD